MKLLEKIGSDCRWEWLGDEWVEVNIGVLGVMDDDWVIYKEWMGDYVGVSVFAGDSKHELKSVEIRELWYPECFK